MRAALGSIERLDKGRYRISIEGARTAEGKRTRVSKVVRGSREDAEVELAKLKLAHGKADGCADGMTVDAAWRAYYEPTFDGRLAKSTARKYRQRYAHDLQPVFGACTIGALSTRQVERGLSAIPGERVRHNAFMLFRAFVNYLWNHDLISSNPFDKRMEIHAPRKHEQPTMGVQHLHEWTAAMDGFIYEATVLMCVYAGLRRGEALGLKTTDLEFVEIDGAPVLLARISRTVDDDGNENRVKTERSERTVAVAGWPASHIRWLVDGMVPGWLAQDEDGARPTGNALLKRYRRWCAKVGIPWYNMRQLRTTYATLSQASGIDATVTSRALGHTTLNMDYAHYFMSNAPAQIAAARLLAESVGSTMYHGAGGNAGNIGA